MKHIIMMLLSLSLMVILVCGNGQEVFIMQQRNSIKHLPDQKQILSNKPWLDFKQQFNKIYNNVFEEVQRFNNFLNHSSYIESHNKLYAAGKKSYKLGLNHFADMSLKEWRQHLSGCLLKQHPSRETGGSVFLAPSNFKAPKKVDWRQHGYVTPVKDQGRCGSCWSFSTTGSLEGQHFKKSGTLVSLSEQQLVDCSRSNSGCNGGLMDLAFKYIKSAGGIESEAAYPYIDRLGPKPEKCKFDRSKVRAKVTGFVDIPEGSERHLMMAVASQGPVSVAIDASHQSFMLYKEGVYDEPSCSTSMLDHGVLAVGYGSAGYGQDYWIVKNSWNTSWGENGYIRMSRNKRNQCGIASKASYPLV